MKNKKIKIFLLSLLFLFAPLFAFASAEPSNLGDAFGKKLKDVAGTEGAGYDTDQSSIYSIIATVIRAVLSLLGVIFLVLTVYGGFLWMTASGNEERVTKAKNILRAAVIGIIIVASAYAISWFVVWQLSERTLNPAGGQNTGSAPLLD